MAKDVCDVLGLENSRDTLVRLDADEKGVGSIDTPGGRQQMLTVNESGLYSLILSSKKPEAKPFKRWITHEVLPSISKTGSYQISQDINTLTRPTKVTFAFLSREYNGALRLAKGFNLEGNQAILSANRLITANQQPDRTLSPAESSQDQS